MPYQATPNLQVGCPFTSEGSPRAPLLPRMTQNAKNRRYGRIGLPKGMQISWQGRGHRTVARVGTLGLGGLFVYVQEPPAVGEVIRVYFEVPGGEVRATAVVRNSEPGAGMGIEFASMDPEPRARLFQLMRRLLGDPLV